MDIIPLQKRLMAMAGLVMLAYLIFHMLTNLSFFSESAFTGFYDFYNQALIRWPLLVIILGAIAFHVKVAVKIRKVNAKARTVDYARHEKFKIPAYLVTLSVAFLLVFIVIHIIQTVSFDTGRVYQELIYQFQSFWMLIFYLAGLFVLTMHLSHSLANVLQTLGKTSARCLYLVWGGALVLTGGFALVPLYIFFVMP